MKRTILINLFIVAVITCLTIVVITGGKAVENQGYRFKRPPERYTFEDLLDAIEQVESHGDPNAIGRDGEVGSFQIKKIYVDDVNMIMGGQYYTYDDRKDKKRSREMTTYYIGHWFYKIQNKIHEIKLNNYEVMARIHNSGPDGWRNDPEWFVRNRGYTLEKAEKKIANSKKYWERVKKILEQSAK